MSLKIFYPKKYLSKLPAVLLATALLIATPPQYLSATSVPYSLDQSGYLETVYDTSNGLGASAANDVVQTPDGFIWVGTYNGLSKYDGTTFHHFPVSKGIYSVADLYVARNGNLFIGTNDSGLALLENDSFKFWNKSNGLSANAVRSITENYDGDLFIGTTDGLNILSNGLLTVVGDERMQHQYIRVLHTAPANKICGITKDGNIFVYNGKTLESFFAAHSFSFGDPSAVEPDPLLPDEYWIGTAENQLVKVKISGDKLTVLRTLIADGIHAINDILLPPEDNIVIAADNGVGFFDRQGAFHKFADMKFNNSVDNITVDYEKNIWFSSSRMGVAKLTYNSFKNVFASAGIRQERVVNSICKADDITYIATDNGLLALRDNKPISTPLSELLKNIRTRQVMRDSKGNLWVSTYSEYGLVKYGADGSIKTFTRKDGLPHERCRTTLEGKDGTIYVGTRDGLAIIRDDKVVKALTKKDGLANPQVLCLLENDGIIYLGTDGGGINLLKNDEIISTFNEQDGLKSGVILRLANDPQADCIWISTGNSIAYLKNDVLYNIDNFPSTNNFDFIFTPQGEMLITCNQGIYVTSSSKMRLNGGYEYVLSQRDGLGGALTANSFNYLDQNGNLYLCLQNGAAMFNLKNLEQASGQKKFCVPSINIDGKEYPLSEDESFTIPSDARRITYKAFVLSNTLNNIIISTYLEGFDKEPEKFSRFDNKERTYTNLAGGTYKLHVGIYDPRTGKLAQEKVYTLVKEKQLSEYPAFYLFPILLIIGIVLTCYRVYTRRRMQNMLAKQQETEKFLDQVIRSFAKAIDLKDHYTRGHSARVAKYSHQLALAMGWSRERAANLYRVALLHDVGKVVIPDNVLNKQGPLNDAEYAKMKEHTDIGASILQEISQFPMIAIGARSHHERYDGKGYGHHLKGEEIPLEARIIAVADTFDAMNSTRVYRPHMSEEKILSELHKARGTQLDAHIVDVLLELIAKGEIEIEKDEK